jgi:hypothetical protein
MERHKTEELGEQIETENPLPTIPIENMKGSGILKDKSSPKYDPDKHVHFKLPPKVMGESPSTK